MKICTSELSRPRERAAICAALIAVASATGCGDALRGGDASSVFAILHVKRVIIERAVEEVGPVALVVTLGGLESRTAHFCRDDQDALRGSLPGHDPTEEVVDDEIVTTSVLDIEGCRQDVPYVAEIWAADASVACPAVDRDWENGALDGIPLGPAIARFEHTIPHELTHCHEPLPDATDRVLGRARLPFVRLKFPEDAFLEEGNPPDP